MTKPTTPPQSDTLRDRSMRDDPAFAIYKAKRPALEAHLNRELGKWDLSLKDSWVTSRFFDFLMDNFWVAVVNAQEEAKPAPEAFVKAREDMLEGWKDD